MKTALISPMTSTPESTKKGEHSGSLYITNHRVVKLTLSQETEKIEILACIIISIQLRRLLTFTQK